MHPYCPTMPCMPRVANFAYIPNMGVALLSCIISNASTKAKEISCSFLLPYRYYLDLRVALNVMNALVDYSSSINAPHEYFDDTGIRTCLSYFSIRASTIRYFSASQFMSFATAESGRYRTDLSGGIRSSTRFRQISSSRAARSRPCATRTPLSSTNRKRGS